MYTTDAAPNHRLRRERESRHLSQRDLAAMAGISNQHLSKIELGQTHSSYPVQVTIALALDMPREVLFPVARARGNK